MGHQWCFLWVHGGFWVLQHQTPSLKWPSWQLPSWQLNCISFTQGKWLQKWLYFMGITFKFWQQPYLFEPLYFLLKIDIQFCKHPNQNSTNPLCCSKGNIWYLLSLMSVLGRHLHGETGYCGVLPDPASPASDQDLALCTAPVSPQSDIYTTLVNL